MPEARNLWDAIPVLSLETGGVWERIDKDAQSRTAQPSSTALDPWLAPSYEPGGVWQAVDEETLLLRPEALSFWFHLERAVAAVAPAAQDVWEDINEETLLYTNRDDLWQLTSDETLVIKPVTFDVWGQMRPNDFASYQPQRKVGWALKPMVDARGQKYFILKNTRTGAYLRLTPEQHFVWEYLDGQHSVKDVTIAFLITFKSFDITGLMDFLTQLGAYDFLVDPRVDVYGRVEDEIERRRPIRRVRAGLGRLLEWEVAINGIDGKIAWLYRAGGRWLFRRWTQVVVAGLTLLGLVVFAYLNLVAGYAPLNELSQVSTWGLVALYVISAVVVLIHELSHALTTKHFRREVRRGGFILYLGFPTWFVDTSDIWLSSRTRRLLVSWAGPYSGFVLAGVCSLLVFVAPSPAVGVLLFQAAFSAYFLSALQLNPLLKSDGYYMLMDWLEIPRLRDRALAFVRKDLWRKVRARERFTPEERIFTVFGGLSLVWTVLTLGLAVLFWESLLRQILAG